MSDNEWAQCEYVKVRQVLSNGTVLLYSMARWAAEECADVEILDAGKES